MIKLQGSIPDKVGVAVSGGPDSMALLDFARRNHRKEIHALFVDHGTAASYNGWKTVGEYCHQYSIRLRIQTISNIIPSGMSKEDYWRQERIRFFHRIDFPVLTAHHLDDCVEEYIINTLKRGRIGIIPFKNNNIYRLLRRTKKDDLIEWCRNKDVPFIMDETNFDPESGLRAHVRNSLRYAIEYKCNPGLEKIVLKLVLNDPLVVRIS